MTIELDGTDVAAFSPLCNCQLGCGVKQARSGGFFAVIRGSAVTVVGEHASAFFAASLVAAFHAS